MGWFFEDRVLAGFAKFLTQGHPGVYAKTISRDVEIPRVKTLRIWIEAAVVRSVCRVLAAFFDAFHTLCKVPVGAAVAIGSKYTFHQRPLALAIKPILSAG